MIPFDHFFAAAWRHCLGLALLLTMSLPTWGQFDRALAFDAGGSSNDYVDLVLGNAMAGRTEFTVEFWMRAEASAQNSGRSAFYAVRNNGVDIFIIYMGGANPVMANSGTIAIRVAGNVVVSNSLVGDGRCHHIAYVYTEAQGTPSNHLYIDGVLDVSYSDAVTFISSDNHDLGTDVNSFNYTGLLDEFRLWTVARTQAEIQANMYRTVSAPDPDLLVYYRFDQGNPGANNVGLTTLIDHSGNALDGTLQGFDLDSTVSNWVDPNYPTISVGLDSAECAGEINQVTLSGNGLNGPLSYLLNGSAAPGFQFNLGAGTHQLWIEDALGCPSRDTTLTLTDPTPITFDTDSQRLSCDTLDLTINNLTGGTPPYQAALNGGQPGAIPAGGPTIFSLSPGYSQLVITDAAGCTVTYDATFSETNPVLTLGAVIPASCADSATGSIEATYLGGADSITVTLDLAGTQIDIDNANDGDVLFSGLAAGTYLLTARDANGCETTQLVTVSEPSPLQLLVLTATNSACDTSTGVIELLAVGGNGGYQYSLLDSASPQPANAFNSLWAGDYQASVEDGNGCIATRSVSVGEGNLNFTSIPPDSVSCYGAGDGRLIVLVSGLETAEPSFDYLLTNEDDPNFIMHATDTTTNGDAFLDFSSLSGGTYELTVTDTLNGQPCAISQSWEIYEPAPLVIDSLIVDPVQDCSTSDGRIRLNVEGGNGDYVVTLIGIDSTTAGPDTSTSGQRDFMANSLEAGDYSIEVTDAKGCTAEVDTTVGLTGISFSAQPFRVRCFGGSDGRIEVTNDSSDSINVILSDTAQVPLGTLPIQANATSTFSNLSADLYVLVDAETNCQTTVRVREPDSLILSVDSTFLPNGYCVGGDKDTLVLIAEGGNGGYTFFNDPDTLPDGLMPDLQAGSTYLFRVEDSRGCQATDTFRTYAIPDLNLDSTLLKPICGVGQIELKATPSGGTFSNLSDSLDLLISPNDSTTYFQAGLLPNVEDTSDNDYGIRYAYVDSINSLIQCPNTIDHELRVVYQPQAGFIADPSSPCVGSPITLTDTSNVADPNRTEGNAEVFTAWRWDLGNGDVIDSSESINPTYQFDRIDNYRTTLEVSSTYSVDEDGDGDGLMDTTVCSSIFSQVINVKDGATLRANWLGLETGLCQGDTPMVVLRASDVPDIQNATNTLTARWLLDGQPRGSVSLPLNLINSLEEESPVQTPLDFLATLPATDLPQFYTLEIELETGGDSARCVSLDRVTFPLLPVVSLTEDEALPYRATFDTEQDAWTPASPQDPLWAWQPAGGADTFVSGTWYAQPDSNLTYPLGVDAALYSPCFDLDLDLDTSLRPYLAMDLWLESDSPNDGARLEYARWDSLGKGIEAWLPLGSRIDDHPTGLGWYDAEEVFSLDEEPGWTGRYATSRRVWHRLDSCQTSDETTDAPLTPPRPLRLRLRFASDERPDSLRGIALSQVEIGNRQRQVLIERFHHATPEGQIDYDDLTELQRKDVLLLVYDLADMYDTILYNPPRARSLYYGLYQDTPRWVMDGSSLGDPKDNLFAARNRLNLRSLVSPRSPILAYDSDGIQIDWDQLPDTPPTWALRLALVKPGGDTVAAILPHPAGVSVDPASSFISWDRILNDSMPSDYRDYVNDVIQAAPHGVLWLQNRDDKQVLGAILVNSLDQIPAFRERRAGPPVSLPSRLVLFPNPTAEQVTLLLPFVPDHALAGRVIDRQGREVHTFRIPAGQRRWALPLGHLADGLYRIQVMGGPTGPLAETLQLLR